MDRHAWTIWDNGSIYLVSMQMSLIYKAYIAIPKHNFKSYCQVSWTALKCLMIVSIECSHDITFHKVWRVSGTCMHVSSQVGIKSLQLCRCAISNNEVSPPWSQTHSTSHMCFWTLFSRTETRLTRLNINYSTKFDGKFVKICDKIPRA